MLVRSAFQRWNFHAALRTSSILQANIKASVIIMETRNIRSEIIHQDLSVYPFRPSGNCQFLVYLFYFNFQMLKLEIFPWIVFICTHGKYSFVNKKLKIICMYKNLGTADTLTWGTIVPIFLELINSRCREIILSHKYPSRDKTDFEQYVKLPFLFHSNT